MSLVYLIVKDWILVPILRTLATWFVISNIPTAIEKMSYKFTPSLQTIPEEDGPDNEETNRKDDRGI